MEEIFKNRQALEGGGHKESRRLILDALNYAIEASLPSNLMASQVALEGNSLIVQRQKIDISNYKRIIVVGTGKAGAQMAQELERIFGDRITKGIVVVPEGGAKGVKTNKIELFESAHPISDKRSVNGAEKVVEVAKEADHETLVISLISGGGSALMELPATGIALEDIKATNELLLASGASIEEINAVRKHLSRIKGGQLTSYCPAGLIISLIISDVIGNDLGSIASGPTVPDKTTFEDALNVLKKCNLLHRVPKSVSKRLIEGAQGGLLETKKPSKEFDERVKNFLLGDNSFACKAAAKFVEWHYPDAEVNYVWSNIQGEARNVARNLVSDLIKMNSGINVSPKMRVYIWGGETTVTVVKNHGEGGRNQEQALAAAIALSEIKKEAASKMTFAFFATDGGDRKKGIGGGFADITVGVEARKQLINLKANLERNDSYNALKNLNVLFETEQTGTNLIDIGIMVKRA